MQSTTPLCKPISFEVLKGMANFGRKDAAARRRHRHRHPEVGGRRHRGRARRSPAWQVFMNERER
jgi:hypothetical protein